MKCEGEMKYRCVECGFEIKTLFVQYSPGNIRLMKCENCKAVADEYVESELMIILIDLLLHKQKAYGHLLYNVLNREMMNLEGLMWKSTMAYLLLDACREFPSSVIFIIDLFIFSSNAVALKVITECDLERSIAACFIAHAVKLLVTQLPMLLLMSRCGSVGNAN